MKLPMREKYVDEAIGLYFEFGKYENGNVDISDGNKDVFCNLPPQAAEKVIQAHNEFRHKVYEILCR